jgi:uncharacterized coiled-coil DUF342 family protein
VNRTLQYANLLGVVALAILCAAQWKTNRAANLQTIHLEKVRLEQAAKLKEQENFSAGLAADLDQLRDHVSRGSTGLAETEARLAAAERDRAQLAAERDQLRASVTNWAHAVSERDSRLVEMNTQVRQLADDRNDAVTKFNEIAGKYNSVVQDLNNRTREYNALVEKVNASGKSKRSESAQ